ncbi:hypothetical protein ARMGADRAFT_1022688 [Armillaria gallica]|uniref:Uncharacterized protein n=1 Tax=Armillaria gallica TaxID=47427 RepID=A0A2H3EXZ6_ARMGA|nr:hypothetical protein ARMGADRAFT_1022688 [Armillaria gallica]
MEKDDGKRHAALMWEYLENMIKAVRQYTSNRAMSSKGELAQTIIYKLTPFMSPKKMLSTELMIQQVYNKQEKMEKKIEQFEDMQMELERRERNSSEEQIEQVHVSLLIQDYAAIAATAPRDGNTAKPARPAKPIAQTTTIMSKPVNPNKAYNPCHMVVQAPKLPIDYERPRPEMVAIRVNEELAKHNEMWLSICILNLQSDQTRIIDEPDGDGIRPAEEVRQELMAKNLDLHRRIIRVFQWVRPEGKLMEEGKYASLVVVLFEKEEDARYMTEERRNVSLYWVSYIVKEFTDKPPVI